MTSVYDLGWFAAKSGRIIKNPYSFGSDNWDYWQEGFNDGISTWAQDKPIKQPIKEQVTRLEPGCWIDPRGKIYVIDSDIDPTHAAWAQKSGLRGLVKDLDNDRALMDLLKKGWIAQRGSYFTVGYPLDNKKKDTIFMRAKELGYDKIGVDAYYDAIRGNDLVKQYLYQQPPEALYESRSLFEQMSDQDLDYIADQTIQLQNKLRRRFPQIDKLYMWFRSSSMDIVVSSIKIKEEFRKRGIGSQIMKAVNEFADQYGLSVSLDPDPQPGYKKKLIDFYKSHGFVRNKGRNTDFRISEPMYRKPQKSLKEMILNEQEITNGQLDLKQLSSIKTFKGRSDYIKSKLLGGSWGRRITSGSGREIFELPNGKILKLAKNPKGVAQNESECDYGLQDMYGDLVTQIVECDDNGLWIVVEKASRISKSRFKAITGIDFDKFGYWLNNEYGVNHGRHQIYNQYTITQEESQLMYDNEFANRVLSMVVDFGQQPGDYRRINSWGEVNRDGKPMAVLVDYGLTDEVYDTHYRR